jgi:prepilin-type N-terminal cleavage/methylation domain-containing protein
VVSGRRNNRRAFTLVELIVALMVTAIISTAAASLAYAMGSANDVTSDVSEKQAQLRYATIRISQLLKHCKLICSLPDDDVAVWRADENSDSQINPGELVYLEAGPGRNYLRLLQFLPPPAVAATAVSISQIKTGAAKSQLLDSCERAYVQLMPQCSNVVFKVDAQPPWTRLLNVSFDVAENGDTRHFQISAAVRSWAGYLLSKQGEIVNGDDD